MLRKVEILLLHPLACENQLSFPLQGGSIEYFMFVRNSVPFHNSNAVLICCYFNHFLFDNVLVKNLLTSGLLLYDFLNINYFAGFLICFSILFWPTVVQSMLGRKCHFKFCRLDISWISTLPCHHLQTCSMYYLRKNDQHISKPYFKTCGTISARFTNSFTSFSLNLELICLLNCFHVLTSDGRIHPLNYIHHTSTYQASLCKLMEYW